MPGPFSVSILLQVELALRGMCGCETGPLDLRGKNTTKGSTTSTLTFESREHICNLMAELPENVRSFLRHFMGPSAHKFHDNEEILKRPTKQTLSVPTNPSSIFRPFFRPGRTNKRPHRNPAPIPLQTQEAVNHVACIEILDLKADKISMATSYNGQYAPPEHRQTCRPHLRCAHRICIPRRGVSHQGWFRRPFYLDFCPEL